MKSKAKTLTDKLQLSPILQLDKKKVFVLFKIVNVLINHQETV